MKLDKEEQEDLDLLVDIMERFYDGKDIEWSDVETAFDITQELLAILLENNKDE
jgi:hypothetical protein